MSDSKVQLIRNEQFIGSNPTAQKTPLVAQRGYACRVEAQQRREYLY